MKIAAIIGEIDLPSLSCKPMGLLLIVDHRRVFVLDLDIYISYQRSQLDKATRIRCLEAPSEIVKTVMGI